MHGNILCLLAVACSLAQHTQVLARPFQRLRDRSTVRSKLLSVSTSMHPSAYAAQPILSLNFSTRRKDLPQPILPFTAYLCHED
jgi:hypothetical protein